eukprot:m.463752 g.463752  ORF g.463752 m.463752 type:complete len:626 (-) comp23153_c0_seq1:115-1992(-)
MEDDGAPAGFPVRTQSYHDAMPAAAGGGPEPKPRNAPVIDVQPTLPKPLTLQEVRSEILMEQHHRDKHIRPRPLGHSEVLAMARLSSLVYSTGGDNAPKDSPVILQDNKYLEKASLHFPKITGDQVGILGDCENVPPWAQLKVMPRWSEYKRWLRNNPSEGESTSYEEWKGLGYVITAEEIKDWLMKITEDEKPIEYEQPKDTNVEDAAKLFVDAQVKKFKPTNEVGAETAEVHKSRMQTMRTLVEFMMEYPDFRFVQTVENVVDLHANIGVSNLKNRVIVAFRGTQSVRDALNDMTLTTKPLRAALSGQEFATNWPSLAPYECCCTWLPFREREPHVHGGFLRHLMRTDIHSDRTIHVANGIEVKDFARQPAMLSLKQRVCQEINRMQHEMVERKGTTFKDLEEIEVLVTGHSLGGGVATIFAHQLAVLRTDVAVNLVTFGSPRVGTPAFKRVFNQQTNLRYLRVQNACDMITQVPFCGFSHVGKHMWLIPRWIAKVLCLDRPEVPTGNGKAPISDRHPYPFDRACCSPCGLNGEFLPEDGRTFAGPSNRPPCMAALPCYLGICCGCWFTWSMCWADHSMTNYIHILNQPKGHPYWYTVLTMRERELLDVDNKKLWIDYFYNSY